jgi:addiction module RelE/StbE family toxin
MNKLIWSTKFRKSAEKFIKQNPDIVHLFKSKILLLEENPFHSSLKTHKLKGRLSSCLSCSINYEFRIVFKFSETESNCIELLNIGNHDEVY